MRYWREPPPSLQPEGGPNHNANQESRIMAIDKYTAGADILDIELIHLGALLDAASENERNLEQTSAIDGGRCADAARAACWELAGRIDRLRSHTPAGHAVKGRMIDWTGQGGGVFGLAGLLESLDPA